MPIKLLSRILSSIKFALNNGFIDSDDWVQKLLVSKAHAEMILAPVLVRYQIELSAATDEVLKNYAQSLSQLITKARPTIHAGSLSTDTNIMFLADTLRDELEKYSVITSRILSENSLTIPKNIKNLETPQPPGKRISETAQKAIDTQYDDLDQDLYPFLSKVITELQHSEPRLVVKSLEGAAYTFVGSGKLFAYLGMKLKEVRNLDCIPWEYIMSHLQPKNGKLSTFKTKASQYNTGDCNLPKDFEQIDLAIKHAK